MRKVLMISLVLVCGTLAQAQDDIKGIWLTHEGNSKIEIYEKEGFCFGKVVWLKTPYDRKGKPHTDKKNPDKSLRGREILGSDLLTDLKYVDGYWKGKIYVVQRGQTLDVVLRKDGMKDLNLEVSFRGFSRLKQWTLDSI